MVGLDVANHLTSNLLFSKISLSNIHYFRKNVYEYTQYKLSLYSVNFFYGYLTLRYQKHLTNPKYQIREE